ncbi:MAG: hypothetical protein HY902_19665 [Deltaproteobacteria bacterium]|nr:hypothetical protein [Deltaproteobacteria bacterium]
MNKLFLLVVSVLALALPAGLSAADPVPHHDGPVAHGPALQDVGESIAIPAGREARTMALLADVGFDRVNANGLIWRDIAIARSQVTFALTQADTKRNVGEIVLRHRDEAGRGDRVGHEFALSIRTLQASPAVTAALEAAAASILARDTGGYFAVFGQPSPARLLWTMAALMAVWAAALLAWLARTRGWHRLRLRFEPTHLLPAVIQLVLYGYWATHVAEVSDQLPRIAAQLGFAFALDALLGLTLQRSWDLTFGPIPVVLSTNLFVWFPPGAFHLALAVIALALGSKWLLRRQGRHIFNPSAFGIAVVGTVCLLLPNLARFQDIAHLISEPPAMLPLLVGLALIAQVRVPVVLITLSSALVLLGLKAAGAYHVVYPFWPAILLALTLLATDPATIPQSGLGKLLYGLSFGVLVWAMSAGLTWLGESDFFGKVLPLPVVNLLVPAFDRAAAAITAQVEKLPKRLRWLATCLEARWNLAHVASWLALAAVYVLG